MTITETIARAIEPEWSGGDRYLARQVIAALTEAGYAIRPATVPHKLYDAIGGLVSECADHRDIYPDAETALEAITSTVNEIYACVEDGVFGPLDPATPNHIIPPIQNTGEVGEME